MIDLRKYGFVDFGSSKAGCLEFATKHFNNKINNGIGVELNPNKCKVINKKGYNVIRGDVTKLKLPRKSVQFITMSHLLEHLYDLNQVNKTIKLACETAKKFVFIEGPSFDFDGHLKKLGYKFYWSDWHGHRTPVTVRHILRSLARYGYPKYTLLSERPHIVHSRHRDLHPLASPRDQFEYDPKIHPPKVRKPLNLSGVFRSFVIFGWLDGIERPQLYRTKQAFKVRKKNV